MAGNAKGARTKPTKATRKSKAATNAATKAVAKAATKVGRKAATKAVSKVATRPAKPAGRALAGDALRTHAGELHRRLGDLYPDAHCELDFQTPLQLLVATILSAQCTDKRVNMVTPALFAAYPTAQALADAPIEHLEELVKTTGFFRMKAKNIQGMARALVERHGGEVPSDMEALVVLPGVGRKTANVVLGNAFRINHGVVVDTHVGRLATRLGLTRETDPVKVEEALMPLFPQDSWTMLSHLLIFHGRRICDARKPRCGECALADVCPSAML
jgi:endonuclease-3